MAELFRDTVFGHALRLAFGGKEILPHLEEKDTSIWKRYVHEEKTARMAHHGHVEEEEKNEEETSTESSPTPAQRQDGNRDILEHSSTTRRSNQLTNSMGHPIDPEKGKDVNVICWEKNDPEVCFPSSFCAAPRHTDIVDRTL